MEPRHDRPRASEGNKKAPQAVIADRSSPTLAMDATTNPVFDAGSRPPEMIRAKTESSADVIRWIESEAASLWPAMLGSLSFRRNRCGHANCPACLSGEQHPSHVLYGRHNGRRFAVYVPEDLVGEVRRAVDNGRALQDLLVRVARNSATLRPGAG
jgi:hypothetical protein